MARVALVTGGTRGIGAAISLALKNAGYQVAANYAVREEAAKEFEQATGIPSYKWDISDDEACQQGAEQVEKDLDGPIEVLVNNAGITRDGAMHKMPTDKWSTVIQTNLNSCFYMSRAVIDSMRENRFGRIINISSINGQLGQFGQTNYSAAKAGIVGMTKAAAKELAHLGVRVNAIQPGLIRSAMTEAMPQRIWDQKVAEVPMGRAGEPSEVAKVALFLASDLSSYMTGTVIEVTGGRHV